MSNERIRWAIAYNIYVIYPQGPLLFEPADWDYDVDMLNSGM